MNQSCLTPKLSLSPWVLQITHTSFSSTSWYSPLVNVTHFSNSKESGEFLVVLPPTCHNSHTPCLLPACHPRQNSSSYSGLQPVILMLPIKRGAFPDVFSSAWHTVDTQEVGIRESSNHYKRLIGRWVQHWILCKHHLTTTLSVKHSAVSDSLRLNGL